jgi:predicted RNA-binding protein with PIN domain
VERIRAWAENTGARALVVFDGVPPDGDMDEHDVDGRVAVAGSGAESADDWLARRAVELHARGRTYWLVTSDRELRDRAGGHAQRTIGGGAFVHQL